MKVVNALRRFYGSRGYIILTAILVLTAHTTLRVDDELLFGGYQEFIFGGVMILTASLGCFVCDDLRFLLMPVISFAFMIPTLHGANVPYYSRFYLEHIPLTLEYVLLLLLFGSILCFIARNRPNQISFKQPVLLGMILFCGTLMLNGIGSKYYCLSDVIYPLTMVIALVGFSLLFCAYVRFDRTVFDHFMFCILVLGVMICLQLVFTYLDDGPEGMKYTASGGVDKGSLLFGWGNSTAIGGMLAFLMPSGFYFAHSHKHGWIYYLLSGFIYIGVVLSQSRGALGAATLTLLLSLVTLFIGGKNRKINRIFTGAVVAVGLVGAVLLHEKVLRVLQTMLEIGLRDRGRFDIWENALKKFLEYPIFGAGFYTDFYYSGWKKDVYPYLYHNTPIQVLSSGGIVAFSAYVWHRFTTVRMVVKKPTPYKLFGGYCILGLLIFCLIEVIFFATYPTLIYAILLMFLSKSDAYIEEATNENPTVANL